jgi:hypothetical protein
VDQQYALDVADWEPDIEFQNYPEGARPKTALFSPASLDLEFIRASRRYLFKRSASRYPDQFWGEIVAYPLGTILGLIIPPAYAAYDHRKQQCGALIEWFYEDRAAGFIPGGDCMQAVIPDYDRRRGTQHNFQTIIAICNELVRENELRPDWLYYWAEVFLFDALIGNTDRHQDNWGIVVSVDEFNKLPGYFSPIFDNGTSLGHEWLPIKTANWSNDRFQSYITRGSHHMKWSVSDSTGCNHFEMVRNICNLQSDLRDHLKNILNDYVVDRFDHKLRFLQNLDLPIPLSIDRSDLYLKLVQLRHQKLSLLLNE